MRFDTIVLAYFVIAAMMWGGGVLDYEETGMTQLMITNNESGVGANPAIQNQVEQIEGNSGLIGTLGGGILLVWDLFIQFLGAMLWPITGLNAVGAPPVVTVALGGPFFLAFVITIIVLLMRRAG